MAWWIVALIALGQTTEAVPSTRLVSGTNVRLRAEPSVEVRVVTTLTFGTELVDLERNRRGWIRVRTPSGEDGWVSVGLTRPVTDGRRDALAESIVEWRLRSAPDRPSRGLTGPPLAAWQEVLAFVDAEIARTDDHERLARLALLRLQTMSLALEAIPGRAGHRDPATVSWLEGFGDTVVYNEPGGLWMLRRQAILAQADRHAGTEAAERIVAFAAENGLPGECEGDLPCYFTRIDLLQGEYLRRYPDGRMVSSVFERLLRSGDSLRRILDMPGFFTRAECPQLLKPVGAVYDAVSAARDPEPGLRDRVLARLDEFKAACALTAALSLRR